MYAVGTTVFERRPGGYNPASQDRDSGGRGHEKGGLQDLEDIRGRALCIPGSGTIRTPASEGIEGHSRREVTRVQNLISDSVD